MADSAEGYRYFDCCHGRRKSSSWLTSLPFLKELPGDTDANGSPNSESSANYSAISSSGEDLGIGLVGLWHLDEASYNGTANEAVDSSGSGNHGTRLGSTTTTATTSIFNNAGTFNAGSDGISVSDSTSLKFGTNSFTYGFWMKTTSSSSYAFSKFTSTLGGYGVYVTSSGKTRAEIWFGGTTKVNGTDSTKTINDGQWHHLIYVVNRSTNVVTVYIDGLSNSTTDISSYAGQSTDTTNYLRIGGRANGTPLPITGQMDEVAVWSRAISADEVLQLYRRGANRNKFQFRTCTQSDCSDNPTWKGPDNTASTWFSELHNMASVAASGDGSGAISLLSPILDFTKWISAVAGWAFNPNPARYFQYHALMESDDENNLCSGSPCMPDIQSVASIPAVAITTTVGRAFPSALTQFNVTKSGDCGTADDVRFQVSSNDGSTYKYWSGSAWTTVTTTESYAQAAAYTATNSNIGTLALSGTFKFKALVPSQYGKTCELSLPSIRW